MSLSSQHAAPFYLAAAAAALPVLATAGRIASAAGGNPLPPAERLAHPSGRPLTLRHKTVPRNAPPTMG
jgi:hypothetical protein